MRKTSTFIHIQEDCHKVKVVNFIVESSSPKGLANKKKYRQTVEEKEEKSSYKSFQIQTN